MPRSALLGPVVAAVASVAIASQAPTPTLVITNTRIVDVAAGRSVPVAAVIVSGDRISSLQKEGSVALPDSVRRIDGSALTLVPALGDLAMQARPDRGVDADYYYALAVAHGVMMIRAVDTPLPWAARQRARIARGELIAPRVWLSAPTIRPAGNTDAPSPEAPPAYVTDAPAVRRIVADQVKREVEWVRVGADAAADVQAAAAAAARAARRRISVVADRAPMTSALSIKADLIEGLGVPSRAENGTTTSASPAVPPVPAATAWASAPAADVRTLATRAGKMRVPVALKLSALADAAAGAKDRAVEGGLDLVPPALKSRAASLISGTSADAATIGKAQQAQQSFVKEFLAAGGRVTVATDAGANGWPVPGWSVHRELALLVGAGVSPAEALRAATLTVAETLGARDAQLAVGARASFIGVAGDPLTDIGVLRSPQLIVCAGEVVDRERLLRDAKRAGARGNRRCLVLGA